MITGLGKKIVRHWHKLFYDVIKVIENGAAKHGEGTWLKEDNPSLRHEANHASMFRHLCDSRSGITKDHESGLHPLLHLACRALMAYVRWVLGIKHPEDK